MDVELDENLSSSENDFDQFYKIVLIGDSDVGKSCIAIRYTVTILFII